MQEKNEISPENVFKFTPEQAASIAHKLIFWFLGEDLSKCVKNVPEEELKAIDGKLVDIKTLPERIEIISELLAKHNPSYSKEEIISLIKYKISGK